MVRQRVRGIEVDDLPEDLDRLTVSVLPLQPGGDFVERREGVAGQPQLLIELRELRADVRVPVLELRDVLRDDLADLLVDRDRFQGEALARVELTDPLVRADRVGVRLHLRLEVTHLQEGPRVVRILLDDLLILGDRSVVLLLLDVLLSGGEYLFSVDRHGSGCSSVLLRLRMLRRRQGEAARRRPHGIPCVPGLAGGGREHNEEGAQSGG